MIPGMGKIVKKTDKIIDNNVFKKIEAIIYSMTPTERSNPSVLNTSRKIRIAKGCGKELSEVNQLLKQFEQIRKMMKTMITKKSLNRLVQRK